MAIYVRSERSGQRVLKSISAWIEKHLKLQVNQGKSGTGRPWKRPFLGLIVLMDGRIALAPRSVERFKARVRELWEARQSLTSEQLVQQWQEYLRGWCGYFGLAEVRRPVKAVDFNRRMRNTACPVVWELGNGRYSVTPTRS